jgi:hypothetical protein
MEEMSKNPNTLKLAQTIVQDSILEYLLACIIQRAEPDQVQLIENSIYACMNAQLDAATPHLKEINTHELRFAADKFLAATLERTHALLAGGKPDH